MNAPTISDRLPETSSSRPDVTSPPCQPSRMEEVDIYNLEPCIQEFVRLQFSVSPTDPRFDRKIDLIERRYVASTGIVELLKFISKDFEVEIPDDGLLSNDFLSTAGMVRIVSRNLRARNGASGRVEGATYVAEC
jgi:hypothetical protein